MKNGASSSYQALQAQFRHRFARGLQALLSYTWAHSIDDVSSGSNILNVPPGVTTLSNRGSSDYDIRQTFSGAISYNIPAPQRGVAKAIAGNWSIGLDRLCADRAAGERRHRSRITFGPLTLGGEQRAAAESRPPGVPMWIADPNVADGKRINPAAFSKSGRNGAGQPRAERAQRIRRDRRSISRCAGSSRLQRAPLAPGPRRFLQPLQPPEFRPAGELHDLSPLFGQATQMLGASLGAGGRPAASIRSTRSAARARRNWR